MDQIFRAPWHDYTSRCIYMVTLKKSPSTEDFGMLAGDCRLPVGQKGSSYIIASRTGEAIKEAIRLLCHIEPKIKVLQYAIMPDHVHILLFVTERTEEILGRIIARFKVWVNHSLGAERIFDRGFNDQILKHSRSLEVLYRYIRENPRRLAVRRQFPEYFRKINNLVISGRSCRVYGNVLLLRNPFKEQVVVHRSDTAEKNKSDRDRWLHAAANDGVLVSPFISAAEKAIREEAEALGGKVVVITNASMGERYKPAGRDFGLCEAGRLLIVSILGLDSALSRSACLSMNDLAEAICSETHVRS